MDRLTDAEREAIRDRLHGCVRCVYADRKRWAETDAEGDMQRLLDECERLAGEVERVRREVWREALDVARGCLDYRGGHREEGDLSIYQHGIRTVCRVLEEARKGGVDTQIEALRRIGRVAREQTPDPWQELREAERVAMHMLRDIASGETGALRGAHFAAADDICASLAGVGKEQER